MNTFGHLFRVSIFGESQGDFVGCTIDGCKPGIEINMEELNVAITRRKSGGKGTTPRLEADQPMIVSGVFNNKTTGAPLTILFQNQNTKSKDYSAFVQQPRPGHADYVAQQKYKGYADYRGGGHFSGRLTLPLVAAGVVASWVFRSYSPQTTCEAKVLTVGGMSLEEGIQSAVDNNDSLGAIVECKMNGLPLGLGEPFFNSCESVIAHLAFSIPAIKGIEFGSGFQAAGMYGSKHNDIIIDGKGNTATNNAGGINGGITNGNELVFRVAVKPASSTPQPQDTFNFESKKVETLKVEGRHDLVIGLRVPPVLEAITWMAMTDLLCCALGNRTAKA
jgi:chorismate synthase